MKTYQLYNDPQHGWLKVKKQELTDLGIADKISHYSYMKGEYAYLEEDCDFSIFLKAKNMITEDGGLSPDFKYKSNHSNKSSRIRNYYSYSYKG